jgi:hypothetical protein
MSAFIARERTGAVSEPVSRKRMIRVAAARRAIASGRRDPIAWLVVERRGVAAHVETARAPERGKVADEALRNGASSSG